MIDLMLDWIRKLADHCAGMQGFLILYSFGGGTAPGFGCLLLERLLIDSGKKSRLDFKVYSAQQVSAALVELSKCTLATSGTVDQSETAMMSDRSESDMMFNRSESAMMTKSANVSVCIVVSAAHGLIYHDFNYVTFDRETFFVFMDSLERAIQTAFATVLRPTPLNLASVPYAQRARQRERLLLQALTLALPVITP
jgi:hypothetical protein